MTKKLYFDVEKADIVYESPDSQFVTARIQAFSTGTSLHQTTCDIETLKRTAPTIFEKPILFSYDDRIRDFKTHGKNPIISGFIVPNSAEFVPTNDGTDRTALVVIGKIWKKYAQKFIDVFKETGTKKKSVSVEMTVNKYEEISNGLINLIDFIFEGVCVLGEFVTPASPGAEMEMLSFAVKENEVYREIFEKEFATKYDQLDFSIPDEVKANCQNGLNMYKQTNSGGTSVSLAYARHIVKETHSTPERIKQAHKYHSGKHDNESEVSFNLWGGSQGKDWSILLAKEIDEIDSKQISYFNTDDSFAKEDLGKGDALKVDKSKDAMSEKAWGEVDKTALRNKILNSSNYKSLVKDVYMLVEEGWEDSPSSHLKYPVMELKGDTLTYNRYGLSAALQRSEGQNETGVVSKVKAIYTKMGLDKPDNNNGMEENKDMTKQEEMAKEEAKIPKEETFEEEKKETPAEEKKEPAAEEKKEEMAKEELKKEEAKKEEPNKANMSLNENLDVAALLEFLKLETQTYRELAGGVDDSINYSINACMGEIAKGTDAKPKVITEAMLSYMKNVSKKLAVFADANAVYAEENKNLKEFKDKTDTEKKSFEIDTVLKEATDAGMPEDELENCKMEAANYSLENIDAYKNMVKAKAFKYFGKKKTAKSGVTRIGLPFTAPQYKEPALWK